MKGCTLMLTRCEEAGRPIDLDLPIGRLSRMDSMQQQRMVRARLRIAGSDDGKKRWEFARRTRYRCQTLPKVQFAGHTLECLEGANLRVVLLRARLPLYTRVARAVHCRGHGTCGTCAVRIDGPVSEPTAAELRRLRLPPHRPNEGLRLACQCNVLGDITVTKYDGFFGRPDSPSDART